MLIRVSLSLITRGKKEAVEAIAVPLSQSNLIFEIPTVPSSGKPASALGNKTIGST
jgi:hypothetical protein